MKCLARNAAILLGLALIVPACGGMHDSGTTAASSTDVATTAQKASAPISTADLAIQASSDAVIESGNPGTVWSNATSSAPSPSSILFPSNLNLNVDLGDTDAFDRARYPGLSGLLKVVASGSVTAGGGIGSVNYEVTVTAITELSLTDFKSGDKAMIAAGAVWSYPLLVEWSHTDPDNWTVKAQSTTTLADVAFTMLHHAEMSAGGLAGTRQVSATYLKMEGVFTSERTLTADKTVTWTDSTGSHTVLVHWAALDSVFLIIDGVSFGPYTRAEVQALFHLRLD